MVRWIPKLRLPISAFSISALGNAHSELIFVMLQLIKEFLTELNAVKVTNNTMNLIRFNSPMKLVTVLVYEETAINRGTDRKTSTRHWESFPPIYETFYAMLVSCKQKKSSWKSHLGLRSFNENIQKVILHIIINYNLPNEAMSDWEYD